MYYVYILECSDGTYYTGWTVNLEERINKHNQGQGAKYTRNRSPVKLNKERIAGKKIALFCTNRGGYRGK